MSEHVPAFENLPFAVCERALKVIMRLVACDWHRLRSPLLTSFHLGHLAEQKWAARMPDKPSFQDLFQLRRYGNTPRGKRSLHPLFLVDEQGAAEEVQVFHAKPK